ncbi:DUF2283 domain-containing protein [Streptomyces niveus]|uniref:DUF2283 domain-containing protein n=1 Tax=Streptomyces niveus TaxID=193462 RepID=UPI00316AE1B8
MWLQPRLPFARSGRRMWWLPLRGNCGSFSRATPSARVTAIVGTTEAGSGLRSVDEHTRRHPRTGLRGAWRAAHAPVRGVPRWAKMAAYAIPFIVLPSGVLRLADRDGSLSHWRGRPTTWCGGHPVLAPGPGVRDLPVGPLRGTGVHCRWSDRCVGRGLPPLDPRAGRAPSATPRSCSGDRSWPSSPSPTGAAAALPPRTLPDQVPQPERDTLSQGLSWRSSTSVRSPEGQGLALRVGEQRGRSAMRVEYDAVANMAYIYLVDSIAPGEAVRQVPAEDDTAILDYDSHGRLLGIELFSARRRLHPELLASAERIDREPRPPRACRLDLAGLACPGTAPRRVVVGRHGSAMTPSSALRSTAPDPAP